MTRLEKLLEQKERVTRRLAALNEAIKSERKHPTPPPTAKREISQRAADRRSAVLKLFESGKTYKQIAEEFGISVDRVGELLKRARRERERAAESEG